MKKITWDNLTVDMFQQLSACEKIENDADKAASMLSIVTGRDIDSILDMPLNEFHKLAGEHLAFFAEKQPVKEVKEMYEINGKKYSLNLSVEKMPTGQFIDYSEQLKKDSSDFKALLSIILIPDGKKYAEGYKTEDIKTEVGNIPMVDVSAICFFFQMVYLEYSIALLSYSINKKTKEIKTITHPELIKKTKREILVMTAELTNMKKAKKKAISGAGLIPSKQ